MVGSGGKEILVSRDFWFCFNIIRGDLSFKFIGMSVFWFVYFGRWIVVNEG